MRVAGHTGPLFGPRQGGNNAKALQRARHNLRSGLEARREEIEQAILTRVYGVADPTEIADFSYVEGLRSAASAALDFGLATIESSEDRLPLLPPILLSQARLAARNGVGLDTVLRRYTAGHALLVDFLIEEIEREVALSPAELRRILAASASAFDRLLAAVSEEHARELESRPDFSQERRRAERVERLLAGEPIDVSDLPYDFGGWHLGIVAQGSGAKEQIRAVAGDLDIRAFVVIPAEATAWGWLGSPDPLDPAQVCSSAALDSVSAAAVGEPAEALAGWRLTHRQATAALPIASATTGTARYADVALITAVLENDLLCVSLRMLYLDPLTRERDGGETLRQTLKTYFEAERNVSSVAALMGVSRRAISKRLQRAEALIGRSCQSAECYLAMLVHEHVHDRGPVLAPSALSSGVTGNVCRFP